MLRLQGLGLCDLKPDRCIALCKINSYLNLIEDQTPFMSPGTVELDRAVDSKPRIKETLVELILFGKRVK